MKVQLPRMSSYPRLFGVAIAVGALLVAAGCATENAYMIEGTPEYQERTAELLTGEWSVVELQAEESSTFGNLKGDQSYIGEIYDSGVLSFDYSGGYNAYDFDGSSFPEVTMTFALSEEKVREKESLWRQEEPDLQVDGIAIVMRGGWQVMAGDGDLWLLFDPDNGGAAAVEVTGTPAAVAGSFGAAQSAALAAAIAAQDAGEEGGLLGTIAGAVGEKAATDAGDLGDVYPPQMSGVFSMTVESDTLSLERASAQLTANRN